MYFNKDTNKIQFKLEAFKQSFQDERLSFYFFVKVLIEMKIKQKQRGKTNYPVTFFSYTKFQET